MAIATEAYALVDYYSLMEEAADYLPVTVHETSSQVHKERRSCAAHDRKDFAPSA